MRSTLQASLAAALLAAGCAAAPAAPEVPVVAVSVPAAAPPEPPPAAKASPRADAPASCTSPGAQFRDAKHSPKPLTPAQQQRIDASEAYLRDHPAPATPRERIDLAEHKYARARAFFEASHWAEAAIGFREVAVDHADLEPGIYASQLYLESLNVLGSEAEPPRAVCYEEMAHDVPIFVDLYCKGAAAKRNAEQCTILRKIHRDIERLSAEKLVRRADHEEANAAPLYEEAGVAYLTLARRCIDEARAAGVPPQQERCDEIAYNAARAFLAARKPDRAAEAAKILLDPRNGMQKTPLAVKLAKDLEVRAAGR